MRDWWQEGRNFYRRLLLMLYVHILVHSGMRPGTETDGLRWCDIEQFDHRPHGVDDSLRRRRRMAQPFIGCPAPTGQLRPVGRGEARGEMTVNMAPPI
jgi:hypothetical protein